MFLENLVVDAVEPRRVGRFWEAAVGAEELTDEPAGYETRLTVERGPVLDLCFQPVPEPPSEPVRFHVDLLVAGRAEVDRLVELGARIVDDDALVLADPEGYPFRVTADAGGPDTGPIAAVALESADPDRDAAFWSWLTGWSGEPGGPLRHPSLRGPLLALRPERAPKGPAKNRRHLDVRLEPGDDADAVEAGITERGGHRLRGPEWDALPWRIYTDPSGNELCVLPGRS
jgi:hypothetical protein